MTALRMVLPKVTLYKYAKFKFSKKQVDTGSGDEYFIPTVAMRIINDGKVEFDSTDGHFNTWLKQHNLIKYIPKISDAKLSANQNEEFLFSKESNDMIVYNGIIFYRSSATSGSDETNRLDTWIPSLGVDSKSVGPIGSVGEHFVIAKLDRKYGNEFKVPEPRILEFERLLGDDLMNRLHNFDIMIMSAQIGGGFWLTENGKKIIEMLWERGYVIEKDTIKIEDKPQYQFQVPLESDLADEKSLAEAEVKFNKFFQINGGCIHKGVRLKQPATEKEEIYKRAKASTATIFSSNVKDVYKSIAELDNYGNKLLVTNPTLGNEAIQEAEILKKSLSIFLINPKNNDSKVILEAQLKNAHKKLSVGRDNDLGHILANIAIAFTVVGFMFQCINKCRNQRFFFFFGETKRQKLLNNVSEKIIFAQTTLK